MLEKLDLDGGEVFVEVDDRIVRISCETINVIKQDEDAEAMPDETPAPKSVSVSIGKCELLPVEKADEDKQIVFGVVLEPDSVDAQKDTVSASEIEAAAHRWLAKYQDRGIQHEKIANAKIEIFESYVTKQATKIAGQKVKKGTWLLMVHVLDNDLWASIKKGDFTGFSMGGFARRVAT